MTETMDRTLRAASEEPVSSSRTRVQHLKRDPEAYALVARVARSRRVSMRALLSSRRGADDVVLARQIAMYLLHVLLGRRQHDVARLLGRPASTVSYACRSVEWQRDRDELLADDIERIETQGWGEDGQTALELSDAA
jgi:chromosomal replication initiation ATPase DnaA